ncbi:MAG: peptidylprolyl isomerase [Bacteroidota bacterium]|nr:peptidylprolyl isomerase [Bacteroidota bacterium]
MALRLVTLFSVLMTVFLMSCGPKVTENVLAKYDGGQVTKSEFEEYYIKNSGNIEQAKKDSLPKLKSFLDLYVNYKLKLEDAKVKGYPSNKDLIQELNDYKKKVGVSFLLEKELVLPGIKNLYERRKVELRAAHIMLRPDSTGDEACRIKANKILDSIKLGKATFEDMAMKYSIDVYSKNVGGDIFYITAGMLPYEFEDACYATEPGNVYPNVVKTKFGYHIIKVTEKQERIPQIRASHILVDFYDGKGNVDSAAAKAKIDTVKMLLAQGKPFEDLARQYSKDPGSKDNGGDLNFFERRMMVKEFDEAAFKLKKGEVSDIIKTNYGYHIIKLTDVRKTAPFEEQKEELKKMFKQSRYQDTYDNYVKTLATKYNYKVNQETLNLMLKNSDSVRIADENPKAILYKDKELMSLNGKSITAGTVLEDLKDMSEFASRFIVFDAMKSGMDKLSGDLLLQEEAANLDKSDNEFASLMEDYRNGIYIFKLQEDEIWSQIKVDSAKLLPLYETTKQNYVWPDRVNYQEIYSSNDSLANRYYSMYQNGTNFDTLAVKYTERPGLKEKAGVYNLVEVSSNQMADIAFKLKNNGDVSAPFKAGSGTAFVKLLSKEPSRIKTFDEARAEVAGLYQENESKRLEQSYNQKLKDKYSPEIFYQNLEQVFKTK